MIFAKNFDMRNNIRKSLGYVFLFCVLKRKIYMDVDSDVSEWLTAEKIVALAIPGYPRSVRRIHDRAATEGWELRTVPSQGRTGHRREYKIPLEVLKLIQPIKRGERASASPKSAYEPAPTKPVNELRVAERRIGFAPPPKDSNEAIRERIKFAETAVELAKQGINPDWLYSGEGPMLLADKPKKSLINKVVLRQVIESGLIGGQHLTPKERAEVGAELYKKFANLDLDTAQGEESA